MGTSLGGLRSDSFRPGAMSMIEGAGRFTRHNSGFGIVDFQDAQLSGVVHLGHLL
jgi:hypothetical protein